MKQAIVGKEADIETIADTFAMDCNSSMYEEGEKRRLRRIADNTYIIRGDKILVLTKQQVKLLRQAVKHECNYLAAQDLGKAGISQQNEAMLDLLRQLEKR